MVKALLFDFDGTLADSFGNFLEIIAILSDKYKLPKLSNAELEELRDEDPKAIMKKLGIPFYKIPFMGRDMKKLQQQSIDKIKTFNGLPQVLRQLKNSNYILGIITSNGRENVNLFLKNNEINIFDYFQGDISLFGKGNAIKKFLKEQKLFNDEILYVGDEIRDIQACKKIGVKIVSVTWGFNSKNGLKKHNPDYLIEKPEDLLKIV